jgi:hypothetical protein
MSGTSESNRVCPAPKAGGLPSPSLPNGARSHAAVVSWSPAHFSPRGFHDRVLGSRRPLRLW